LLVVIEYILCCHVASGWHGWCRISGSIPAGRDASSIWSMCLLCLVCQWFVL